MKNIKLTASSAKERRAAEQEVIRGTITNSDHISRVLQASLLSRLKHPNIVSYRESFQDSSCVLHIIMGYCEGGDLSSRLKAQGGRLLPERQVVEWFVQICLALQVVLPSCLVAHSDPSSASHSTSMTETFCTETSKSVLPFSFCK